MFTLSKTKFQFIGDEYIFAEISRDMSLESNFKALAITNDIRRRNIPGIIDICPANASYLVRFNPEIISPIDLQDYLKEIDITKSNPSELNLKVKIVEIPTWYDDPVTREYSQRYKLHHQTSDFSNFEFVMKINGFSDKQAFINAHSQMPYLITMVGFSPGTAWEFPLGLHKDEIIQTPKYVSPRTETPRNSVGIGGAFTVVYPDSLPGGYQLIGMSAVPVINIKNSLEDLKDTYFLARPGDMWKHRPIDESEYQRIVTEVSKGTYRYHMKSITFVAEEYLVKGKHYIKQLMEDF
ncbi:5-oxoprolinase subunit B family protein [Aneurinibacillus sp. REN35]|uniref:5-oxoprolinase subunit B family protein n=1 Tax=Aneurinibacillus sp. REN35 TaxID=3237286 RepID=UPI003529B5ED